MSSYSVNLICLISGSYEVIKARDRYFTIDDMTEQLPNMENIDNIIVPRLA